MGRREKVILSRWLIEKCQQLPLILSVSVGALDFTTHQLFASTGVVMLTGVFEPNAAWLFQPASCVQHRHALDKHDIPTEAGQCFWDIAVRKLPFSQFMKKE